MSLLFVHLDSLENLTARCVTHRPSWNGKGKEMVKKGYINGQYQIKIPAISHIISHEFFPPLLNSELYKIL
jgi:hypothetical protein